MEVSINQILEKIQAADKILITSHIHPDGDSLGSMLGLSHYLLSLGKSVLVAVEDEVPPLFHFLPGNQSIHHSNDISQLDQYDLLIVLDTNPEIARIGEKLASLSIPVLNIDHHLSNNRTADYYYIDNQAAATGEIIFQLLVLAKAEITRTIAVCLYTAIATDCGFFRYANTTAKTLQRASLLVEFGAQPNEISESLEAITLTDLTSLRDVLSTLELAADGKIAAVTLTQEILAQDISSTDIFINYIRKIIGVEIAIMYKVVDTDLVRVSLRSHGADVNQVAQEFGGGGHKRAAGCSVRGTIAAAKQQILKAAMAQLAGNQK
ncbi:MAG: phosphoesterase RecJ domain protein [Firmicutes bacterium]|nr:phosphoesterase RecJ domain protein [Bacillota bacterium]